jgi:hypothetical protein
MPRKLLLPIALIVALALAAPSSAGQSHDTKVTLTTATFEPGPGEFVWAGKVKSDKGGCVTDRKVFLRNESDGGEPVSSDRAKANGEWEVRLPGDGLLGDYYAQVKRLEKPAYTCKPDKSPKKPLEL